MTGQDEPEVDQYDRYTSELGGRPTVRNTGIYSDYSALQRLGVYMQNYIGVMATLAFAGEHDEALDMTYNVEELEDYSAILLAAMAYDTEALQAGYDLFNDPQMTVNEQDALEVAMRAMYGDEGTFTIPIDPNKTYTEEELEDIAEINRVKMPKVPWPEAPAPGAEDMRKASAEAFGEQMDLVLQDHGQGHQSRDFYSRTPITVSAVVDVVDWVGEAVGTDVIESDPNYGDLVHASITDSFSPGVEDAWQKIRNMGDVVVPGAIDLLVTAGILGAVGSTGIFGAAARTPTKLFPPLSRLDSIPRGAGAVVGAGWRARRAMAGAYFGASATSLAYSASQAGNTDESVNMGRDAQEQDILGIIYDKGAAQTTATNYAQRRQESEALRRNMSKAAENKYSRTIGSGDYGPDPAVEEG